MEADNDIGDDEDDGGGGGGCAVTRRISVTIKTDDEISEDGEERLHCARLNELDR